MCSSLGKQIEMPRNKEEQDEGDVDKGPRVDKLIEQDKHPLPLFSLSHDDKRELWEESVDRDGRRKKGVPCMCQAPQ